MPTPIQNETFLKWLIIAGLIEGTSTLALFFVAMPLKYMCDMPMAVTITGMVHGLLFLGLVAMVVMARSIVPIPRHLMWWGLVGAVVPFGPFIVDIPLLRLLRDAQASDEDA